ncbi:MAG: HlyC/CorC family transporter [Succinivibrio sp.]
MKEEHDHFLKRLLGAGKPESIEDLEDVIDDARGREIISRDTEDMIKGVFDVGRQRVSEIMIPRLEMETIPLDATFEEAAKAIAGSGHSRYPVISEGDKDKIEGILLAKDLLPPLSGLSGAKSIREILRKPVIVPESKRVSAMLREFQNERFHMALVVDEFGGVSGLITIEDILELIVGDIEDEYDEADEQPDIARAREKGTYIVNGQTPAEDFEEFFKLDIPDPGVDTVAGMVLHVLGAFPKQGAKLKLGALDVEVLQVSKRRISLLKVTVPSEGASEGAGK